MNSGNYLIKWKWSPTDPKGSSLVRENGGSLTFLPNLGSVALFIHLALIYSLLTPLGRLLQRIGICKRRGILKNVTPNSDKLSN